MWTKFGAAFSAFLLLISVDIASAQTLREATEQAIANNPEVLASVDRRLAAKQGLTQARAGYFPRVDFEAGSGREQLDSPATRLQLIKDSSFTRHEAGVTVSQMLFDGFAVRSEVEGQEARIALTAASLSAIADDVALRVVAAYLEVLRRNDTIAAARENLAAHEHIYQLIKIRTESGVGRRADLEQAEGRLALAKASLRAEESSLEDARLSYLRVVGSAPQALQKPTPTLDNPSPGEQVDLDFALLNHPAIKAAEANIAAASALQSSARSALSPRLDLELSANRDRDPIQGQVNDKRIMLNLRYNFSRGGADQARIRETGYQVDEAREELNRTRREIRETLSLAFNANRTARDRLLELRQYVASSNYAREAYAKQFSIGQRTLLDLLNAENEYFNASLSYLAGQYSELASVYRIHAGMGQLLSKLGVALPADAASTISVRTR